ncbi:MAG: MFS transporter, partial [Desulfobulbaceae bacterium]|nr:MFS transporter [Desulfobulbaceae bacterium]
SATSYFPVIKSAFFLLGLSAGMYLPSAIATISDLFLPHQWGRAFGVHELAPNLAFLTAPLLTAMLLPQLHWQQYIRIFTLFSILSAIMYAIFGKGACLQGARPNLHHCRSFIRMSEFWVMILLFSMGITGTLGVYSILPMFLVSEHGMSEQSANMLVGLSRSTTLITAFLGGVLADRFGNRRTMAAVLLLTGLATALLGIGQEAMIGFRVWLQPVVAVCFFPPAFAVLSNIGSPETRNVVISLSVPTSFVVGGGLIPALISRMADMGLFSTGLVLTGLFICSGSILVRLLPDKQQQQ